MKTICYMRVSSPKRSGKQSTELQRHALKQWAKEQRLKPDQILWLEDYSTGRNDKREGFQELMRLCREGKVNQICLWKIDRLHRDTINTLNTIKELMTLKIKITCLTQGLVFEENAYSAFLITLMSALASMESQHASERIKAGLAVAKENGVKLGRKPDQRQRQRILKMKAQGKSVAQIADQLGKRRQTIYAMLKTIEAA